MADFDLDDPLGASSRAVEGALRAATDASPQTDIDVDIAPLPRVDPRSAPRADWTMPHLNQETREYLARAQAEQEKRKAQEREFASSTLVRGLQSPENIRSRLGYDIARKVLESSAYTKDLGESLRRIEAAEKAALARDWLEPHLIEKERLFRERAALGAVQDYAPFEGAGVTTFADAQRQKADLTARINRIDQIIGPHLDKAYYEKPGWAKFYADTLRGAGQNFYETAKTFQRFEPAAYLSTIEAALDAAQSTSGMEDNFEPALTLRLETTESEIDSGTFETYAYAGERGQTPAYRLAEYYDNWARRNGRGSLEEAGVVRLTGEDKESFEAYVRVKTSEERADVAQIDAALQQVELFRAGDNYDTTPGERTGFSTKDFLQGNVAAAENIPTLALGFGLGARAAVITAQATRTATVASRVVGQAAFSQRTFVNQMATARRLREAGLAVAITPTALRGYAAGYRRAIADGTDEDLAHATGVLYMLAEALPERVGLGVGLAAIQKRVFKATTGKAKRSLRDAVRSIGAGMLASAPTEVFQEWTTSIGQSVTDIVILDDGSTLGEVFDRAKDDAKIGLLAGLLLGAFGGALSGGANAVRRYTDPDFRIAEDEATRARAFEKIVTKARASHEKTIEEVAGAADAADQPDNSAQIARRTTFGWATATIGRTKEEIESAIDQWKIDEKRARDAGLDEGAAATYADLAAALSVGDGVTAAQAAELSVAVRVAAAGPGLQFDGSAREALDMLLEADPAGFSQMAQGVVDRAMQGARNPATRRAGLVSVLAERAKDIYGSAQPDQYATIEKERDRVLAQQGFGEMTFSVEDLVAALSPEVAPDATENERNAARNIGIARAKIYLEGDLGLAEEVVDAAIRDGKDVSFRTARWEARVASKNSEHLRGLDRFIQNNAKFHSGQQSVRDLARAIDKDERAEAEIVEKLAPEIFEEIEKDGSEYAARYNEIVARLMYNGRSRALAIREARLMLARAYVAALDMQVDIDAARARGETPLDFEGGPYPEKITAIYVIDAWLTLSTESPFRSKEAAQISRFNPPEDDDEGDAEETSDRDPRLPLPRAGIGGAAAFDARNEDAPAPSDQEQPTAPRDVGAAPLPGAQSLQPYTRKGGEVIDFDALREDPKALGEAVNRLDSYEISEISRQNAAKGSAPLFYPTGVPEGKDPSARAWREAFKQYLIDLAKDHARTAGSPERAAAEDLDKRVKTALAAQPYSTQEAVDALEDAGAETEGPDVGIAVAPLSDETRARIDSADGPYSVTENPKRIRAGDVRPPDGDLGSGSTVASAALSLIARLRVPGLRPDQAPAIIEALIEELRSRDVQEEDAQQEVAAESEGQDQDEGPGDDAIKILGGIFLRRVTQALHAVKLQDALRAMADNLDPGDFGTTEEQEASLRSRAEEMAIEKIRAIVSEIPATDDGSDATIGPFVVDAYGRLIYASDSVLRAWAEIQALDPDTIVPIHVLRSSIPLAENGAEITRNAEQYIKEAHGNPFERAYRTSAWRGYAISKRTGTPLAQLSGPAKAPPLPVVAGRKGRFRDKTLASADMSTTRAQRDAIWMEIGYRAYSILERMMYQGPVASRADLGGDIYIDETGARKAKRRGFDLDGYLFASVLPDLIAQGRLVEKEIEGGGRDTRIPVAYGVIDPDASEAEKTQGRNRNKSKKRRKARFYYEMEVVALDANGTPRAVKIFFEQRETPGEAQPYRTFFHGMKAERQGSQEEAETFARTGFSEKSKPPKEFFGATPPSRQKPYYTARKARPGRDHLVPFPGDVGPHLTTDALASIYAQMIEEGVAGSDNEAITAQKYEVFARSESPLFIDDVLDFSDTPAVARQAYDRGAITKETLQKIEDVFDYGKGTYEQNARAAADILRNALLEAGYDSLIYQRRGSEVLVPLYPPKEAGAASFNIYDSRLLAQLSDGGASRPWRPQLTSRLIALAESLPEDVDGFVLNPDGSRATAADVRRFLARRAGPNRQQDIDEALPTEDQFLRALYEMRKDLGQTADYATVGAQRPVIKDDLVDALKLSMPAYIVRVDRDANSRGVIRGITKEGAERVIEFRLVDPTFGGKLIRGMSSVYMDPHDFEPTVLRLRLSVRKTSDGYYTLHADNIQSEVNQHQSVGKVRNETDEKILAEYNKDIEAGVYYNRNGDYVRFTDEMFVWADLALRHKGGFASFLKKHAAEISAAGIDPIALEDLYEHEKTRRSYLEIPPVDRFLLQGDAWRAAGVDLFLQAAVAERVHSVSVMRPEHGQHLVGSADSAAYARWYGTHGIFPLMVGRRLKEFGILPHGSLPKGFDEPVYSWADGVAEQIDEPAAGYLRLFEFFKQISEANGLDPDLRDWAERVLEEMMKGWLHKDFKRYLTDNQWVLRFMDAVSVDPNLSQAFLSSLEDGVTLPDGSVIAPVLKRGPVASPTWDLNADAREKLRAPVEIAQEDRQRRMRGFTLPRLDTDGNIVGAEVGLTGWSDNTTLIHEHGHVMLLWLRWMASQPWASEDTKQRYARIQRWLGLRPEDDHLLDDYGPPGSKDIATVLHERFANAVVRYHYTGVAPVPWLQEDFGFVGSLVRESIKADRLFNFMFGEPDQAGGRETDFVQNDVDLRSELDRFYATDQMMAEAAEVMPMRPLWSSASAAGMTQEEFSIYRRQVREAQLDYFRTGFMIALSKSSGLDREELYEQELKREFDRAMVELNSEPGSVWSILEKLDRPSPKKTKNPYNAADDDVRYASWQRGYNGLGGAEDVEAGAEGVRARQADDAAAETKTVFRVSLASILDIFRTGRGAEAFTTLEAGVTESQDKIDALVEKLGQLDEPHRALIQAIRKQGGLSAALMREIFGDSISDIQERAPGLFRADGRGKTLSDLDVVAIEEALGEPVIQMDDGSIDPIWMRNALTAELQRESSIAAESFVDEIEAAENRVRRYRTAMRYFEAKMRERTREVDILNAMPGRRRKWTSGPEEVLQLPVWIIDDVTWSEDGSAARDDAGRVVRRKTKLPKGVTQVFDLGFAANLLGVSGQIDVAGERLMQKLLTYRPMKDVAMERARERAAYLDPRRAMTPSRAAEITIAARGDLQVELFKRELRHFKKFSDARGISTGNAEAIAREKLSRVPVKEAMDTERFRRQQQTATRRERQIAAMISRDVEKAKEAKSEAARVRMNLKISGHWHELALARSNTMEAFYMARMSAEIVKRVELLERRAKRLRDVHIKRLYSRAEGQKRVSQSKRILDYFDIDPAILIQIENILKIYILAPESDRAWKDRKEAVSDLIERGLIDPMDVLPDFGEWRRRQFGLATGSEDGSAVATPIIDNTVIDGDQEIQVGQGRRRSYNDITVLELEALFEVLDNLEFLGRERVRTRRLGEELQINKDMDTIEANIAKRARAKPKVLFVSDDSTWGQEWSSWAAFVPGSFITMAAYIRDYIDNGRDIGLVYKKLVRPFQQAEINKIRLVQGFAKKLNAAYTKHLSKREIQELRRQHIVPGATGPEGQPISMSAAQRIAFGLNLGTQSNEDALRDGPMFKDNAAAFDAIKDSITVQEWLVINEILVLLKEMRPMITQLEMRTTGVAPKFIESKEIRTGKTVDGEELVLEGGYMPLMYDDGAIYAKPIDVAPADASSLLHSPVGQSRAMTRQGFLISRRGSGGKPVRLDLRVIDMHIRAVAHDLAFREAVMEANRYFHHPRFQAAVKESGRAWLLLRLDRYIRNMAEGEISVEGPWSAILARLKANWTTSLLALSTTTIAVQTTGHIQSAALIKDPKHLIKGWADGGAILRKDIMSGHFLGGDMADSEINRQVMSESEVMRLRGEVSNKDVMQAQAFVGSSNRYYIKLSDGRVFWLPDNLIEAVLRALQVDTGFGPMASQEASDWVIRNMFYLTVKAQQTVDVPLYLAAKEEFLAKNRDASMSDAIAYAENIVSRAQGAVLFADQTPFQQGSLDPRARQSAWQKHWVFMHTYFATKTVLFFNAMNDMRYGPPEERWARAAHLARVMFLIYFVEAFAYVMMTTAIKGGFADGEEPEILKRTLQETGGNVTSQFYLLGDFYRVAMGYEYSSGALGPVIAAGEFAEQMMQGEADKAFVKKGIMALSAVRPFPGVQTNRIIEGIDQESPVVAIGGNLPPK